jgi:hypothetical protein
MLRWREKVCRDVRKDAENMDEGALDELRDSMRFQIKILEAKCGEINCILDERYREFLKNIANQ